MGDIAFEKVWKVYPDGTEAVRAVDLSIDDGALMVLVGPSGCGKTTLLRMVAGLEEVTAGTIRIGERPVNDVPGDLIDADLKVAHERSVVERCGHVHAVAALRGVRHRLRLPEQVAHRRRVVRAEPTHIEVFGARHVLRIRWDVPYVRNLPTTLTVLEADDRGGFSERTVMPQWGDPFVQEWIAFHDNVVHRTPPRTSAADFRHDLDLFGAMVELM